jgi:hypothetical protein
MACNCAKCRRLSSADRRWGFDRRLVRNVECLKCGRKIGRAKYRLVTVFARFGEMFFVHRRCA